MDVPTAEVKADKSDFAEVKAMDYSTVGFFFFFFVKALN